MPFRLRAGRASGSEAPTRVNTVGGVFGAVGTAGFVDWPRLLLVVV